MLNIVKVVRMLEGTGESVIKESAVNGSFKRHLESLSCLRVLLGCQVVLALLQTHVSQV